jgi:ABC-type sugar transport system, periplasmic component
MEMFCYKKKVFRKERTMKKYFAGLFVVILALTLVFTFSLSGCKATVETAAAGATTAVAAETTAAAAETTAAAAETTAVVAQTQKTFYWLSHGQEGDPIWVAAQGGAKEAGDLLAPLGIKVVTSFHHGDVASQKEAFSAAIAAGAAGIACSSPEVGVLTDEVKLAHQKGIPVVFINTDDKATGRDAFVGPDIYGIGLMWANYLVNNKLVKKGDFVALPVEVPGATYQTDETKAIASVFDPLGIKYQVIDVKYEPADCLANLTDYLTAHGKELAAMISLGDLVTGSVQKAFDASGMKPGQIPVVGWGNSIDTANAVKAGYVNAAIWSFPESQGYLPIYMLLEATLGRSIAYDIYTQGFYYKDGADNVIKLMTQK